MPWTTDRFPPAMQPLPAAAREKAIEIANALLAEGYDDGLGDPHRDRPGQAMRIAPAGQPSARSMKHTRIVAAAILITWVATSIPAHAPDSAAGQKTFESTCNVAAYTSSSEPK